MTKKVKIEHLRRFEHATLAPPQEDNGTPTTIRTFALL